MLWAFRMKMSFWHSVISNGNLFTENEQHFIKSGLCGRDGKHRQKWDEHRILISRAFPLVFFFLFVCLVLFWLVWFCIRSSTSRSLFLFWWEREKERVWIWVDEKWGGSGRSWGKRNNNQTILYEKNYFQYNNNNAENITPRCAIS